MSIKHISQIEYVVQYCSWFGTLCNWFCSRYVNKQDTLTSIIISNKHTHITLTGKNIIDCNRNDDCDNGQYTCEGDGCEIKCSGKDSCDDSRFYCTGSCSVECTEEYACADTNFYFTGGEVTVDCTADNTCSNAAFYASNATVVTFSCEADSACEDSGIYMSGDSTFSIECDGSYACSHLYCYCQGSTGCETSGTLTCHEDAAFDFFVQRYVILFFFNFYYYGRLIPQFPEFSVLLLLCFVCVFFCLSFCFFQNVHAVIYSCFNFCKFNFVNVLLLY